MPPHDPHDPLEIAYRYLGQRERTVAEMRARLERAGVAAAEIESAIDELVELGYLDDARYARVFAEDRRNLDAWGTDRIERVLRERGIDGDLIAEAVGGQPAETELAQALAVLERRLAQPSGQPRERERALGMLIRKGYDSELAYEAVRTWSAVARVAERYYDGRKRTNGLGEAAENNQQINNNLDSGSALREETRGSPIDPGSLRIVP